MNVTDIARQHSQVPVRLLWQRKQELGFRTAGPERGNAAVSGVEERARLAERIAKRLVRFANFSQVRGQAIDEFERSELAMCR